MMTLTELEEKGIPVEGNKNVKGLKRALESTESNTPKKQSLYILFVGQLSYSVKEEDLEKHLRANGLRGDVKIRILNDMNGTSRGTAFVECEGATEMYEGLKAHRTILHGRRINVEKSLGGGKDNKRERLKVQRVEQETAVREKIDTILKDYESAEVITVEGLGPMLHERFYSYQPTHVQEILSKFATKPKKDRSLPALDTLMDEADVQLFGQRKLDQFKQLSRSSSQV
jgi:RNA recognition motif-containing protein